MSIPTPIHLCTPFFPLPYNHTDPFPSCISSICLYSFLLPFHYSLFFFYFPPLLVPFYLPAIPPSGSTFHYPVVNRFHHVHLFVFSSSSFGYYLHFFPQLNNLPIIFLPGSILLTLILPIPFLSFYQLSPFYLITEETSRPKMSCLFLYIDAAWPLSTSNL